MIERLETEVNMLERHVQVLRCVLSNEPIGMINLAKKTGYPQHKVRYSLRVLENAGLVTPTPRGAIMTEQADDYIQTYTQQLEKVTAQLTSIATASSAREA